MSDPACYIPAMNKNYTEIVFVLDRSGSMQSCQEAAIAGFNRFLVEQQQLEGVVKLTLVLFDDEYLVPIDALPAAEVLPLDDANLCPPRRHGAPRRDRPGGR